MIPTKPNQRVTAAVYSGAESKQAGLQIRVDGEVRSGHVLPFANKKKPLRACVGSPLSRSSVWNAWANRTLSDVYIAIRSSASLHKISLHESGDFRYQLIDDTIANLARRDLAVSWSGSDDSGRIMYQWRRPPANDSGWTDCLSILVPASELQPGPANFRNVHEIVWIPEPATDHAIEIKGFLVQPGKGALDLSSAMSRHGALSVLGGFKLANGEVFVMISATIPVPPEQRNAIEAARKKGRGGAHPEFDWAEENVPRMLMTSVADDSTPAFIDARA